MTGINDVHDHAQEAIKSVYRKFGELQDAEASDLIMLNARMVGVILATTRTFAGDDGVEQILDMAREFIAYSAAKEKELADQEKDKAP